MRQREEKDKQKTRRNELGKFFYDLAKTTFAVMVVGNMAAVFGGEQDIAKVALSVVLGMVSTCLLALFADRMFNH